MLLTRDAIVTVGAMIASELYGTQCPVVLVQPADFSEIAGAARLLITAGHERGEIILIEG